MNTGPIPPTVDRHRKHTLSQRISHGRGNPASNVPTIHKDLPYKPQALFLLKRITKNMQMQSHKPMAREIEVFLHHLHNQSLPSMPYRYGLPCLSQTTIQRTRYMEGSVTSTVPTTELEEVWADPKAITLHIGENPNHARLELTARRYARAFGQH